MGNHFQLVAGKPKAHLVAGMTRFLGTYTAWFNRRRKLFGHFFSGRYKSLDKRSGGVMQPMIQARC
jgi:hypothetical protein